MKDKPPEPELEKSMAALAAQLAAEIHRIRSEEGPSESARPAAERPGHWERSHEPEFTLAEQGDASPRWDREKPRNAVAPKDLRPRLLTRVCSALTLLTCGWVVYSILDWRTSRTTPAKLEAPALGDITVEVSSETDVDAAMKAIHAFLRAESVQAKLYTIRDPERVARMVKRYYQRNGLTADGLAELNLLVKQRRADLEYYMAKIIAESGAGEAFLLFREPDGRFVVDWETFTGYNPVSWEELRARQPAAHMHLRVYARAGDYYNYEFEDRRRYACVELHEPRTDQILYGYVDRRSADGVDLLRHLARVRREIPVMVEAGYPESPVSSDQMHIHRFVQYSWLTPPRGNVAIE